jgi:hypothetical protein
LRAQKWREKITFASAFFKLTKIISKMAKKKTNPISKPAYTPKVWKEADLIDAFQLIRVKTLTPLMQEWLNAPMPAFDTAEQQQFENIFLKAFHRIEGWSEEDLKMKFIAPVLELGQMSDDDHITGYFDKTISAQVQNIHLVVKSDFMLAKGILDTPKRPFFHFQEYKPSKNPTGDSMAQLLEAFLIAQAKNQDGKPIYGAEIMGAYWRFVVMDGKTYCMANPLVCTKREDLLQIIAVLRQFKVILYEQLLN